MIKVLHVISELGSGGVESMLLNYYQNMNHDAIRFDFIVHGDTIGMKEDTYITLGSRVFHVTPKKDSFLKNAKEIRDVIKHETYDVVHCHQNLSSFSPLFFAKRLRVPIRIFHSHTYREASSFGVKVKYAIYKKLCKVSANYFFAGSYVSGTWMHGKSWKPSQANQLMPNLIDTKAFKFDPEIRHHMRKKLGVEDRIVLLNVGRLSEEKNHMFMLEMMHKLIQVNKKYILILLGAGPQKEVLKARVHALGLEDYVRFIGIKTNVSDYMNAADIFILPSKHEGFGVALVESQATGLVTYASNSIPKDAKVTDLVEFIEIDDVDKWVKAILETKPRPRFSRTHEVEEAGFSIEKQTKAYVDWIHWALKQDV